MTVYDEYGFGSAANVGIELFATMARGTGRTFRLIERVANGDQIIVADAREAERIRKLLISARKPGVTVLVVPPGECPIHHVSTAPRGRTFYEHNWVYEYWHRVLDAAARDLVIWQQATSKTWPQAPDVDVPDLAAASYRLNQLAKRLR
jgi:hypothetical protein